MSGNGQIIEIPTSLTVRELALRMKASPIDVIKILMSNGVMTNINQQVDYDTASIVASELGFETCLEKSLLEVEEKETGQIPLWRRIIAEENESDLVRRPPVITILGHVDHGKTTLLDAIRHTNVVGGEAGGITQHIGAYQIEYKGQIITFLDTPGHAAFTAMRARGAQGADIVILVVAADDGVMPQTREAINHAKAAQVPIIVALNKMDRPDANSDFVKHQLAEIGLVPDEWDGDTMIVPVSAKQKTGLEDLMEAILLVSDSMDIKANPKGKVFGTVIEAEVEKSKGVIATLLIQNGTLKSGEVIVAGSTCGRIRAMFDFRGNKAKQAGPSTPALVMGLSDVPEAGDIFQTYGSEKEARAYIAANEEQKQKYGVVAPKATLEELFEKYQAGEVKELNLIIKSDVQGSLEPIVKSLNDIGNSQQDIKINILHTGNGDLSESDAMLAAASKAILIGFNVQADSAARRLAEKEGISIRLYTIIYRLIEDIEKALKGMLAPEIREVFIGEAIILQTFKISKVGKIAGCKVVRGEIRRNAKVRISRIEGVLFEGEISSLKHEKEDVREVRQGFACGMGFRNFNDYQEGDKIECFLIEEVPIL